MTKTSAGTNRRRLLRACAVAGLVVPSVLLLTPTASQANASGSSINSPSSSNTTYRNDVTLMLQASVKRAATLTSSCSGAAVDLNLTDPTGAVQTVATMPANNCGNLPSQAAQWVSGTCAYQVNHGCFGRARNGTWTLSISGDSANDSRSWVMQVPPAPPTNVSASVVDDVTARVSWTRGDEPDLVSFVVYEVSNGSAVANTSVSDACQGSSCATSIQYSGSAAAGEHHYVVQGLRAGCPSVSSSCPNGQATVASGNSADSGPVTLAGTPQPSPTPDPGGGGGPTPDPGGGGGSGSGSGTGTGGSGSGTGTGGSGSGTGTGGSGSGTGTGGSGSGTGTGTGTGGSGSGTGTGGSGSGTGTGTGGSGSGTGGSGSGTGGSGTGTGGTGTGTGHTGSGGSTSASGGKGTDSAPSVPKGTVLSADSQRSIAVNFKDFAAISGIVKLPPLPAPQLAADDVIPDGTFSPTLNYGDAYVTEQVTRAAGPVTALQSLVTTFGAAKFYRSVAAAALLFVVAAHVRLWVRRSDIE